MKTFIFNHKYSDAVLTISEMSFEKVEKYVKALVDIYTDWDCEDKKGQKED